MPRIRSIKSEHWNDKELANLHLGAHLLWIGMWNFSDDDGIIEADPLLIRSQVFPRRTDIRTDLIEQWIGQLVKARYIIPFEYRGSGYYIHRTFKTHQKIDKPKPSKIPKEIISNILEKTKRESENDPRRIPDESPTNHECVGIGEEGNGEERKGGERTPPPPELLGIVIYDAEQEILSNAVRFEQICMKTGKDPTIAKEVLRKYHLYLIDKEQYPKGKNAVYAGFEKWLMNEKKQTNGTEHRGNTQSGTPIVKNVTERNTRGF